MANKDGGSALLGILVIVVGVAIAGFSGFKAWEWCEPDSFLGYVGFTFLWGILTSAGIGAICIIMQLFTNKDNR